MRPAGAVVAAVAAAGSRRALTRRPPGGAARWMRTNHAGSPVSLLAGPSAALGVFAGGAAAALTAGHRRAAGALALAVGSAAGFGLLDDLAEDAGPVRKGLRGHLGALAQGELTTGGAKVLGIGAGALAAVLALGGRDARSSLPARVADTLTGAALIAGSANLVNLLDLRPGRALKAVTLPALALVCGATRTGAAGSTGAGIGAALLGTGAVLAGADLAGREMLGDAGANALGAAVGVGVLVAAPRAVRLTALAVVVALTATSEKVSFSALIDRTPLLRTVDAWGRPAGAPR